MAEFTLRRMTIDDVPAVAAIEHATFPMPWSEKSFRDEMTTNKCARYLVVVDENNVPVGFAGVWVVIDEGHITNIAVRPDRQGMGYGEMVARGMIQLAADSGMNWMTLEVRRSNVAAQNLYHKLGFIDVGYRKR